MIRSKWLPHPRALLAFHRHLSSIPPSTGSRWKIPGRRDALTSTRDEEVDELAQWRSPKPAASQKLSARRLQPHEEVSRQRVTKRYAKRQVRETREGDAKFMLTIKGLPTTLRSSDFRRLSGQHLSDWKDSINEVHQERDPWTFEPLGTYRISFSSSSAAELYEAKIARLLRLAQIKLHSNTSLWISNVPPQLRGQADLAEELDSFTLLPGSYLANPSTSRSRIKGKWPWQLVMDRIMTQSGFTGRPVAVLLEQHHPSFLSEHIQEFIQQDGIERGNPWPTSPPYHLMRTFEEKVNFQSAESTRRSLPDDLNFRNTMLSRFVVPCKSPEVAWRFIRSWNQRMIEGEVDGFQRHALVTASFIEF